MREQLSLGNNIKSTTITDVQILTRADTSKENTIHSSLMDVESIYFKTIIKKQEILYLKVVYSTLLFQIIDINSDFLLVEGYLWGSQSYC